MPFGITCKEFEAADWRALEDSFSFALDNSFSKEAEGDWRASEDSFTHALEDSFSKEATGDWHASDDSFTHALENSFSKVAEEEGGCDTFEKETGTTCPDSPGHMPGSVLRCLGTERRTKAS